ncbi:MAG TPA: hypothetical protein VK923_06285 [Euzebyales bacterium]|nr:hypothetical protein [Euzebyales bacterium]
MLERTGPHRQAPPFWAAWWEMARGRLAACQGDGEQTLQAFRATGRHHEVLQINNPAVLPRRSEAGLVASRLGRLELARNLISEEETLAESFGAPRAIGVARRAAGLLARGHTAVQLLQSAVVVLADSGARVEHARALTDLGRARRRDGRPAEARRTLRTALALAEDTSAEALATQRATSCASLAGGPQRGRGGPVLLRASGASPSSRPTATATGRSPTACSSPSRPLNGTCETRTSSRASAAASNSTARCARCRRLTASAEPHLCGRHPAGVEPRPWGRCWGCAANVTVDRET